MARILLATLLVLLTVPASAADKAAVCQANKLKAAGKHALRTLDCHAVATTKARALDPACVEQAKAKLAKAFALAEKKTDCPGTPDPVGSEVDELVTGVLDEVATGGNSYSVDVNVEGQGTLEVEFTSPVGDSSFGIDEVLVEQLRWDTGATSTLRVVTYHGNESGYVTVFMAGPSIKGRVLQSPGNASVDFFVEGGHFSASPGQPFDYQP